MQNVQEAHSFLSARLPQLFNRFYISPRNTPFGAGLIIRDLRMPIFLEQTGVYATGEGFALILTHECDVDPTNSKIYNEYFIFCPIIEFPIFFDELRKMMTQSQLSSYLAHLASCNIYQLAYIPEIPPHLPYGGVLYFNRLSHAHISVLKNYNATTIGMLSQEGFLSLDMAIENHLRRPKATLIPRLI
ncbi:MAG: hypothetical protein AB7R90_04440 [Reyranellaceae bacterium]